MNYEREKAKNSKEVKSPKSKTEAQKIL